MNETATIETPTADDGWQWAHLEVMGHRSHWGRMREEERFGTKMLRIDVPIIKSAADLEADATGGVDAKPAALTIEWQTHYYSGGSIFSYRLTDEATVLLKNKPYEPAYRMRYRTEAPQLVAPSIDLGQTMEEAEADNFGLTEEDLAEGHDDEEDDGDD